MAIAALIALIHDILVTVGIYSLVRLPGQSGDGHRLPHHPRLLALRHHRRLRQGRGEHQGPGLDRPDDLHRHRQPLDEPGADALDQHLASSPSCRSCRSWSSAPWLLGASALQDFGLALFIGLLTGAYSSIFIASPVLADAEGTRAPLRPDPPAPGGPDRPARSRSRRPPRPPVPASSPVVRRWPAGGRPRSRSKAAAPAAPGPPGRRPADPGRRPGRSDGRRCHPPCRRPARHWPAAAGGPERGRQPGRPGLRCDPHPSSGRRRPGGRQPPAAPTPQEGPAALRRSRSRVRPAGAWSVPGRRRQAPAPTPGQPVAWRDGARRRLAEGS